MELERRRFGDEAVSVFGLGCSRVGSLNNPVPIEEIRRAMDLALELGVSVLDTADSYGQGDSEREIGTLLRGRRPRAFVITKVGQVQRPLVRLVGHVKPLLRPFVSRSKGAQGAVAAGRLQVAATDFDTRRLMGAVVGSLKRLRSEAVDGLLLHGPCPEILARDEIKRFVEDLLAQGKARHVGVSCDSHDVLAASLSLPRLSIVQTSLDVLDEARHSGIADTLAERGIGVFAREVIRYRSTMAPADALASAVRRPEVSCVLAGASTRKHVEELVRAVASEPTP